MVVESLASGGGMERGWIAEVLLHNGGFFNACTMKRCLHRTVDFKTNALNNAHVSQLLHYYIL